MHIVGVKARIDRAEHPLRRAAPVLVGKAVPVALDG